MGILGHLPSSWTTSTSPSPSPSSSWRRRQTQTTGKSPNLKSQQPHQPPRGSSGLRGGGGVGAALTARQRHGRTVVGQRGKNPTDDIINDNAEESLRQLLLPQKKKGTGDPNLMVVGDTDDNELGLLHDTTLSSSYSLSSSFSDVYLNDEDDNDNINKNVTRGRVEEQGANKEETILTKDAREDPKCSAGPDAEAPQPASSDPLAARDAAVSPAADAVTDATANDGTATPSAPPKPVPAPRTLFWPLFPRRSARSLAAASTAVAVSDDVAVEQHRGQQSGEPECPDLPRSGDANGGMVAAVLWAASSNSSQVSDLGFHDPAAAPAQYGSGPNLTASSRQVVSVRSVDDFLFGTASTTKDKAVAGAVAAAEESLGIGPVLVSTAMILADAEDDWEAELSQRSVNSDETATAENGKVDVRRMKRLLGVPMDHHHNNKGKNALFMDKNKVFTRSASASSTNDNKSATKTTTTEAATETPWWKRDIVLRPAITPPEPDGVVMRPLRPAFLPATHKDDHGDGNASHSASVRLPGPLAAATEPLTTTTNAAKKSRHSTASAKLSSSYPASTSSRRRLLIKVQADSWKEAVESLRTLTVEDWSDALKEEKVSSERVSKHNGSRSTDRRRDGTDTLPSASSAASSPMSMFSAGLDDCDKEPRYRGGPPAGIASTPASAGRQSSRQRSHGASSSAASSRPGRREHPLSIPTPRVSAPHENADRSRMKPSANAGSVLDVLENDSFLHSSALLPTTSETLRPSSRSSRHVVKLRVRKATTSARDDVATTASAVSDGRRPRHHHQHQQRYQPRPRDTAATHCSLPVPATRDLDDKARTSRRHHGPLYQYQSKIMVQI